MAVEAVFFEVEGWPLSEELGRLDLTAILQSGDDRNVTDWCPLRKG